MSMTEELELRSSFNIETIIRLYRVAKGCHKTDQAPPPGSVHVMIRLMVVIQDWLGLKFANRALNTYFSPCV